MGFYFHKVKSGSYIWAPPPACADVALEQLRVARIKRQSSIHVFVCPRLFSLAWLKQMIKACDFYFEGPVGTTFWPDSMHEPLTIGVCLPYFNSPPFEFRRTPKVLSLVRQLRGILKKEEVAATNLLHEFHLKSEQIPSMTVDVVWRLLHFRSQD